MSPSHEPAAPYPDHNEWLVQMLLEKETWGTWRVGTDLEKARACLRARQAEAPGRTFRLVRVTTVHTIEDGA